MLGRAFDVIRIFRRSLDLNQGKQSKGKFTQFKDLYFPKGCGSLDFDLTKQLPQSRSRGSDIDNFIGAAQTLNEQFLPAPRNVPVRRTGNKNDGFYYPDFSGRYIHDNRGQYIPDNRGLYVHIPGPDGPPALPYVHISGPFGPNGNLLRYQMLLLSKIIATKFHFTLKVAKDQAVEQDLVAEQGQEVHK